MERLWLVAIATLLLGPVISEASEPVFLAPVYAGVPDDAALAKAVEAAAHAELLSNGYLVLDAPALVPDVPSTALEMCSSAPSRCASDVISRLPVRVGVLTRVDRLGNEHLGHVELYGPTGTSPLATADVPVVAGREHQVANEVLRLVSTTVERLGPAPDRLQASAEQLLTEPEPVASAPAGPVVAPTNVPPRVVDPIEQLESSGVPTRRFVGARERYVRSGLHPRDFLFKATPHAGRVILEMRAGFAWGDVDRQVLLRSEVRDGTTRNQWYREAPARGTDFQGGGYLGYAPTTVFELGVLAGFQYSSRIVNTQTVVLDGPGDAPTREEPRLSLVQAIDVVVQPRLRLYAVALGPAKPYVFGGAEIKLFQKYQLPVEDLGPEGGWIPGAVAGLGIVVDPGPLVGLFAEGSYTLHFGPRTAEVTDSATGAWQWVSGETPLTENLGGTVTVTGGVQFRL